MFFPDVFLEMLDGIALGKMRGLKDDPDILKLRQFLSAISGRQRQRVLESVTRFIRQGSR